LAAVGGGVWGAFDGAVRGLAVILAIVLVASLFGIFLGMGLASLIGRGIGAGHVQSLLEPVIQLIVVTPITFGASRRSTAAVARQARRPLGWAGLLVGLLGGSLLAAAFLFVHTIEMAAGPAIVETGVVIAWGAGAASVGRIPDIALSRRAWLALVFAIGLMYAFVLLPMFGSQYAGMDGHRPPDPNLAIIGQVVPDELRPTMWADDEPETNDGTLAVRWDLTPDEPEAFGPRYLPGWTDLRLELWPALPIAGARFDDQWEVGELDPAYTDPIRVAPVTAIGDRLVGSIRYDDIRGLDRAWIVATAVSPDGDRRVLMSQKQRATFRGTLLDWLTSHLPGSPNAV
jgi:hypothetical protein